VGAFRRLLNRASDAGRSRQFVRRLPDELVAVSQYQHLPAVGNDIPSQMTEHNRFAGTGRQNQQRLVNSIPRLLDTLDGRFLVRS